MLSLSLPLPLFKRNAAGITRGNGSDASSDREGSRRTHDIQSQVHALWQRLDSLRARAAVFRVGPAASSTRISVYRLPYARAGEIGLLQLLW